MTKCDSDYGAGFLQMFNEVKCIADFGSVAVLTRTDDGVAITVSNGEITAQVPWCRGFCPGVTIATVPHNLLLCLGQWGFRVRPNKPSSGAGMPRVV